jgi:hypothetical protein
LENIQRNFIYLYKGNLKEISQFFEGNFGQNKEKKRIFLFFKVEALFPGRAVIVRVALVVFTTQLQGAVF